jgi:hypothetical protein
LTDEAEAVKVSILGKLSVDGVVGVVGVELLHDANKAQRTKTKKILRFTIASLNGIFD